MSDSDPALRGHHQSQASSFELPGSLAHNVPSDLKEAGQFEQRIYRYPNLTPLFILLSRITSLLIRHDNLEQLVEEQ